MRLGVCWQKFNTIAKDLQNIREEATVFVARGVRRQLVVYFVNENACR